MTERMRGHPVNVTPILTSQEIAVRVVKAAAIQLSPVLYSRAPLS